MDNRKQQAIEFMNDANKLYNKQLYDEALSLFYKIIELDPLMHDAYFNISKTLVKKNQFAEAFSNFERVIKIASEEQIIFYRKGFSGILFNSQEYKSAFQVFLPIIEKGKAEDLRNSFLYSIAAENIEKLQELSTKIDLEFYTNFTTDEFIPEKFKNELTKNEELVVTVLKTQSLNLLNNYSELLQFIKDNLQIGDNNKFLDFWNNLQTEIEQSSTIADSLKIKEKLPDAIQKLTLASKDTNEILEQIEINQLLELVKEDTNKLEKSDKLIQVVSKLLPNSELKKESLAFLEKVQSFQTSVRQKKLDIIRNAETLQKDLLKESDFLQTKIESTLLTLVNDFISDKKIEQAFELNNQLLIYFPENKSFKQNIITIEKLNKNKKIKLYILFSVIAIIIIAIIIIFPTVREKYLWNDANKSNDAWKYEKFVQSYPQSVHFKEADSLRELLFYNLAVEQNSLESFNNYLSRFPNSKKLSKVEISTNPSNCSIKVNAGSENFQTANSPFSFNAIVGTKLNIIIEKEEEDIQYSPTNFEYQIENKPEQTIYKDLKITSKIIINNYNSNFKEWSEYNESEFRTSKNNGYVIEYSAYNSVKWLTKSMDINEYGNYDIEFDLEKLNGRTDLFYGINFGVGSGSYYYFLLNNNKYVNIGKYENGRWNNWKDFHTSAIQNGSNSIKLSKQGTKINVYINSTYVADFYQESFYGNSFGFLLYGGLEIKFTKLKITQYY